MLIIGFIRVCPVFHVSALDLLDRSLELGFAVVVHPYPSAHARGIALLSDSLETRARLKFPDAPAVRRCAVSLGNPQPMPNLWIPLVNSSKNP
jgi:hypothetical protein